MRTEFALGLLVVAFGLGCNDEGPGSGIDASFDAYGLPACKSITKDGDCRARPDCVVDTCTGCSCSPGFAGCRAPSDDRSACPDVECPFLQCCHASKDCSGGAQCAPPPYSHGCGTCFLPPETCQTDGECAAKQAGTICDQSGCECAKSCRAGCATDMDCGEQLSCGADFRCHPAACGPGCTGVYACDSSAGVCRRKQCTTDGECGSGGYCVEGACQRALGECILPAA